MSDKSRTSDALIARVREACARIEKSIQRWPSGTHGGKGGQFAPKVGGGGGGGSAAVKHPKAGPGGKPVEVKTPTSPTGSGTWADKSATAVFVPGGEAPKKLNGVALSPWRDAPTTSAGWQAVSGQKPELDAGWPLEVPRGKHPAAGVVIEEPDGRVWVVHPTNGFGGYKATFPKGTAEDRIPSLQANAIKEAYEESGLKVEITGVLGDVERTTSVARYYTARRVGGTPTDAGWETQGVSLVPRSSLKAALNHKIDKDFVDDLDELMPFKKRLVGDVYLGSYRVLKQLGGKKAASVAQQARWPAGTPLGGQWKAVDSRGITKAPMIAKGAGGKNPAYQKKADALYSAAKSGDSKTIDDFIAGGADKIAALKQKPKLTSHDRWNMQLAQYAGQLKQDMASKADAGLPVDAPSPKAPSKVGETLPLNKMKYVGEKPGGSASGGIYLDADGNKWLVKGYGDSDMARSEVLASRLYNAAGIAAPEMRVVDLGGKYKGNQPGGEFGVASRWHDDMSKLNPGDPAHLQAARSGLGADAWLANRDAVGMGFDNITIGKDGTAMRVDPGGSLEYRAMGAKKTDFGNSAEEINSLRDPSKNAQAAAVFKGMTNSEIAASIDKVSAVSDETITRLVDKYGPGDAAAKKAMAEKLIARKQDLTARAAAMKGLDAQQVAVEAEKPKLKAVKTKPAADPEAAAPAASSTKPLPAGSAKLQAVYNSMHAAAQAGAIYDVVNATLKPSDVIGHTYKAHLLVSMGSPYALMKGPDGKTTTPAKLLSANKEKAEYVKAQTTVSDSNVKQPRLGKPMFGERPPKVTVNAGVLQEYVNDLHAAALTGNAGVVTAVDPGLGIVTSGYKASILVALGAGDTEMYGHSANATAAAAKDFMIAAGINPPHLGMSEKAPRPAKAAAEPLSPLPPMPDFDSKKLLASNTNAGTINKKIDALKAKVAAGDIDGILATKFGVNSYEKNLMVPMANDALAAMGSPHKVTAGQQAGAHPALANGGSAKAQTLTNASQSAEAAAAAYEKPKDEAPPADAPKKEKLKPKTPAEFDVASMPGGHDFANFKGAGAGLSSLAWKNEANQAVETHIKQLALQGDMAALKGATYDVLDSTTGVKTGAVKPVSEHQSKYVVEYHNDMQVWLNDQLNPPRPAAPLPVHYINSVAEVASLFPPKKFGTTVGDVKSNEKFGFWIALGHIGPIDTVMPKKTGVTLTNAERAAAYPAFKAMSSDAKAFVQSMQASGQFAQAYRDGQSEYGGKDLKALSKAALKHAVDMGGKSTYRWQNMQEGMIKQIKEAEPGVVLQANGPMPTSMSETGTKHFGTHRIRIHYAPGAKAVLSFGSGGYKSEEEITTLPNSRFVLLSKKEVPDVEHHGIGTKNMRLEIDVLMLPPDLGLS